MTPDTAPPGRRYTAGVILIGLTLIGIFLRLWKLDEWSFADDEIFTLRDSRAPTLSNPRPLIYLLNYLLIRPLMPLDELGLRLLPALFGILAIPALYLVVRRLAGTRPALFAALLLTFNGYHIYQSQFARYWSLVFLLSAIYPFALYHGVRERNRGLSVFGIVTALLAVLAHPVSLLPLLGLGLFLLLQLKTLEPRRLWSQVGVRVGAGLIVVVAAAVAVRYGPVLYGWIFNRPRARLGEHLLHTSGSIGVRQGIFMLGFMESVSFALVITGVVGIYLLWHMRRRELASLLACLFFVPVGFIVLISMVTAVSTTYLLPAVPVLFIGAGVLLDQLSSIDGRIRPPWLVSATMAALVIGGSMPGLISQYSDGRRANFRAAASWLEQRLGPADVLFSDQYRTMTHYMRSIPVRQLSGDTTPLSQTVQQLAGDQPGSLWIVAPVRAGVKTNPGYSRLKQWIFQNCQLRHALGEPRLDFRRNDLQIFRCPPQLPVSAQAP